MSRPVAALLAAIAISACTTTREVPIGPPVYLTARPGCSWSVLRKEEVIGPFTDDIAELRRRGAGAHASAVVVASLDEHGSGARMSALLVDLDCGATLPAAAASAPRAAPVRSTAEIRLETNDGYLQREYVAPPGAAKGWLAIDDGAVWEPICKAPCAVKVDATQTFSVGGPGKQESSPFHVGPGEDVSVRGHVGPAFATFGLLGLVVGLTEAMVGGVLFGIEQRHTDLPASRLTPELIMIGGGVLVAGVGLPIWLVNRTRVDRTKTVTPSARIGRSLWLSPRGLEF